MNQLVAFKPSCRSCHWSEARERTGVLWCRLLSIPAGEVCRGFVYEPGAEA